MTIEITLIISIISVSTAVFFGIKSHRRNDSADTERRARESQQILDAIANISHTLDKIVDDLKSNANQLGDHDSRIMMLENGIKQVSKEIEMIWERVKELEKK